MDRLYQAVGGVGCCVLLAGRDGVPVDRRGTPADDATFESWGLWTGSLWSEEHEGTNGIGTGLVEQRGLTIARDQHFFTRNTLLSCTAVPIYDHDARLAGVLDVSSCRADRTDIFVGLIALTASEAARRIEADLFRAAFANARIVLTPSIEGHGGGLLAVDADDLVIGASRSARAALGIAVDRVMQPTPVGDLLGDVTREQFGDVQRGVLLRGHGNVSAAAKTLGVSRAPLHRKLKRFEINGAYSSPPPDIGRTSRHGRRTSRPRRKQAPIRSVAGFPVRRSVGQIIPWNFPLLMACWKLAPALAAGNCVVLKPAEQTPASIMVWIELVGDILPPGVLNIVNGFGLEAGKPLASSPRVAKIAFTGETSTGRLIMQYASQNLIPVTLELGGKSPNIFFQDVTAE